MNSPPMFDFPPGILDEESDEGHDINIANNEFQIGHNHNHASASTMSNVESAFYVSKQSTADMTKQNYSHNGDEHHNPHEFRAPAAAEEQPSTIEDNTEAIMQSGTDDGDQEEQDKAGSLAPSSSSNNNKLSLAAAKKAASLSFDKAIEFVTAMGGSKTPPPSPDGITADDPPVSQCETCDIHFVTKRERSEHLRDVHGVEKPFKCEHCHARFPYSSSLYNHIRIHSESKPFKCNVCNAAFRWKNSLRHHRLYIHKEEPTNVQIMAKCVLEGKKPPPNPDAPPSAKKSRGKGGKSPTTANAVSDAKSSSSMTVANVAAAAGASASLQEDDTKNSSAVPGRAPAENASATMTGNGGGGGGSEVRKRKRKPKKLTPQQGENVASTSNITIAGKDGDGGGHTCGHCELEFPLWADLVSHIKVCAEKEKAALDDTETTTEWIPATADDDGQHCQESEEYEECRFGDKYDEESSDSDASALGGLVIDQGDGSADHCRKIEAGGGPTTSSSNGITTATVSPIFSKNDCDSKQLTKKRRKVAKEETTSKNNNSNNNVDCGNINLERRVEQLEKHLDEICRHYDDRIGSMELAILGLQSKVVKKE